MNQIKPSSCRGLCSHARLRAQTRLRRWAPWGLALALALVLAGLGGCSVRIGGKANAADKLREENMKLQDAVRDLSRRLELRRLEVQALEKNQAATQPAIPGAEKPILVSIAFARYSGALDTNNDGIDDLLRLYIFAADQFDRFITTPGRMVVQAVYLQTGREPQLVTEKTFEPPDLHDAYRTGFTGTHYALNVPLPTLNPAIKELVIRVTFINADNGNQFNVDKSMAVNGGG